MLNETYMNLVSIMKKRGVKFLVAGSYAMALYGCPRNMESLELWVEASLENSEKIYASLEEFKELPSGLKKDTFTGHQVIQKIGKYPDRIDIITTVQGVQFHAAFDEKCFLFVDDMNIPFISREDLIKNRQILDVVENRHDARDLKKYRSIPLKIQPWY